MTATVGKRNRLAGLSNLHLGGVLPPAHRDRAAALAWELRQSGRLADSLAVCSLLLDTVGGSTERAADDLALTAAVLDAMPGEERRMLAVALEALLLKPSGEAALSASLASMRLYDFDSAARHASFAIEQFKGSGGGARLAAGAWLQLGNVQGFAGAYRDAVGSYLHAAQLYAGLDSENAAEMAAGAKVAAACQLRGLGEWARAFELEESRFIKRGDLFIQKTERRWEPWNRAHLAGRDVLLYLEQGIGDQLQALRLVPWFRAWSGCRRLRVFCHRPLVRLVGLVRGVDEAFSSVGNVGPSDDELIVPIGDLQAARFGAGLEPLGLDESLDIFDSLTRFLPTLSRRPPALGPGLRVGLVWFGNREHIADWNRSYPLAMFGELARLCPGVEFVSVLAHKGGPGSELLFQSWPSLPDWNFYLLDVLDAVRVVSKHVDLVVTVDTAMAHLCGLVGAPAVLVHGSAMEWRWRYAPRLYPSLSHVGQTRAGDHLSAIRGAADLIRAKQESKQWR